MLRPDGFPSQVQNKHHLIPQEHPGLPDGVIVVALLLLIVPSFLQAGFGGYLLQHILALLPSNIMSFDFTNYTAYAVGGKMISCLSMDLIVNGAAAVIFSAAGYGMFRKHQVNQ